MPTSKTVLRMLSRLAGMVSAISVIAAGSTDVVLAAPQSAAESSLYGGCILREPIGSVPADLYQVTDVIASPAELKPFTKVVVSRGLTLAGQDDASDAFMRLVAETIAEMLPQDEKLDLGLQAEIIRNHYRYRALIPIPVGQLSDFPPSWRPLQRGYSVCDIIMQDVKGQVMEVVEHILHYVSDIGLHHTFPDQWGLFEGSELATAMREAIRNGYYDVSSYDEAVGEEERLRVLLQEFAYWFISTAWNLQQPYGPVGEQEWQLSDREQLQAALPDFFRTYVRTVERTMVPPSAATLARIGPTRAEESGAAVQ